MVQAGKARYIALKHVGMAVCEDADVAQRHAGRDSCRCRTLHLAFGRKSAK